MSDIERFQRELELTNHAQKEQQKWMAEMTKRQNNIRALVQLIVSSATDSENPIPQEVADAANQYGLAPLISGIPVGASMNSNGTPATTKIMEPTVREEHEQEITTAAWIVNRVIASGNEGISPPELLRSAKVAGINMHQNYPYVVLRKAVENDKIEKKGSRYVKKGQLAG